MTDTNITLSESAARQINAIMSDQSKGPYLRVAVEGGGCSGFQYVFDFDTAPDADDITIERDGARVLIDTMSAELMRDSIIDYTQELIGSAFKIRNPNAVAACGCGTSFAL